MTEILSLLSGGWSWIAGVAAVIVALAASYFGGKKIGTTQTQAKADVTAAQKEVQQTQQVADKQAEITQAVKNVQQDNNSVSDSAARERMRTSKYHSDD